MRRKLTFVIVAACSACAIDIGVDERRTSPTQPQSPVLAGCRPLLDHVSALEGRLDAQTLPNGTTLLVTESPNRAFLGHNSACFESATPLATDTLFDGSAVGVSTAKLLAAVNASGYCFFNAASGIGIARWNSARMSFEALSLLWTADRPNFGSAAAVVDGYVYAFGGLAVRFLAADVYLARAPLEHIADFSAYEYWQGGGGWTPDVDRAVPIFEGGLSPSILFDATRSRWLAAYTSPLSNEVQVRSGLNVSGPWSSPYVIGRCELPPSDHEAFCGDVTLLSSNTAIRLSYAIASFRTGTRNPLDYWTRVTTIAWPSALP
ncbi:MAG: DUF4185 domain-containing protein [Myxococcota bacterium]